MNPSEFKLAVGNWSYVLKQDSVTGELVVVSLTPKTLVQKAKEYVKAEISVVTQKISLPVIDQRKEVCSTCDSVKQVSQDRWFCKSCGCGEWERSRLQVKWEMPAATCPLRKWTG
jgi:ribosomal protein S27AE